MVECSICNKPAIYVNRISNIAYCKQHFIEYFERRVRKTIRKYNMIKPGDRIALGVSGGKDSMALLHLLLKLRKKIPRVDIVAVLVDEGIKGYREKTIDNLVKYASEQGVKYIIASFKDYIGKTLDEIVLESFKRNLPYMPCSYCGVFRRYVLNKVAGEIDANIIATAHNMDDIVQTFIMNLVNNSWDRIVTLNPVRKGIEGVPTRIKPFYEVPEKETALYALLNGLTKPEFIQCPYIKFNVRHTIRKLLNELEDKYLGSKYGLLRSLQGLIEIQSKYKLVERRYTKCAICGQPSSNAVCKACTYRASLDLMNNHELQTLKEITTKTRDYT
ncbi:MAG: TIGR00269 family protein [Desulfurococcaceae archaeon]